MKIFITLQRCWKLSVVSSFVLSGAIIVSGNYAWSQVVQEDNTLGSENSLVTSPIPGEFLIEGGATRGTNLFHSFSEFSVPTNGIAYFNNAVDIQNIISRVTGGSVSNIDGLIKANGTANLFLINPNGIIFGPNASLDVNGSFVASTADSLVFDDGFAFSATAPQAPPLLTISAPLGLQYGSNAGSIQVQGATLQVPNGKTLALVGGNVQLNGADLQAPGGRVELGGLSTSGRVGLNENGSLNFPNNVARSDVFLTNGASVNVRAGGGGFITINARNLEVLEGSQLIAGIGEDLGTPEAQAGDVQINASHTVSIDGNESTIENKVNDSGLGNAGNIEITTGSLFLSNNALLSSETRGRGNAGDVIINASDTVSLNSSEIETEVEDKGEGKGGNIEITTNTLSLNEAFLEANTEGQGDAGKIIIRATDSVSLDRSNVLSQVEGGEGNSGGIEIITGSLFLSNNALLSSETRGRGNAGDVIINASDTVSLNSSEIETEVEDKGEGKGGNIEITTNALSLVNGAFLEANTEGQGDAGKIIINATDSISLDRSNVSSKVEGGEGNSGGIEITTNSLSLVNGALLEASTFGQGDAGKIIIRATDSISLDSSNVFNKVEEGGEGNSGGIEITTGSLFLSNSSHLSSETGGQGNAGAIIIEASDSISLDHSEIEAEVEATGEGRGGNIEITTNSLFLVNGASLETDTEGKGDAGKVIINASDTVFLNGSVIEAEVQEQAKGNAGGIEITTNFLSLTNGAELNVSSLGQGNPGDLEIKADSVQLDNQAKLTAQTASGNGGNITMHVQDLLLLRDNSQISTTAGTAGAGGEGGKITIDANFIVAVPLENSDITANAFNGNGGTVTINASGVFGMVVRSREDLVSLLGTNDPRELDPGKLPTNDITAISQTSPSLNGVVSINTPDVDPSRGVINLPVEPVNVEVAQGCQVGGKPSLIAFFNTGKGGLAPNPYDPLSTSNIWEDVPSPTQRTASLATANSGSASPATLPDKIEEAQGWLINEKAQVVFVAEMSTTDSQSHCRLR